MGSPLGSSHFFPLALLLVFNEPPLPDQKPGYFFEEERSQLKQKESTRRCQDATSSDGN